jgi:hypothetical protein
MSSPPLDCCVVLLKLNLLQQSGTNTPLTPTPDTAGQSVLLFYEIIVIDIDLLVRTMYNMIYKSLQDSQLVC